VWNRCFRSDASVLQTGSRGPVDRVAAVWSQRTVPRLQLYACSSTRCRTLRRRRVSHTRIAPDSDCDDSAIADRSDRISTRSDCSCRQPGSAAMPPLTRIGLVQSVNHRTCTAALRGTSDQLLTARRPLTRSVGFLRFAEISHQRGQFDRFARISRGRLIRNSTRAGFHDPEHFAVESRRFLVFLN
jgi:hypothetical protein